MPSLVTWLFVALACALALSAPLRRLLYSKVLFPLGYAAYTHPRLGLQLFRSMASTPSTPHSETELLRLGEGEREVRVQPVALFEDNYAYILLHPASKRAALVDPADPKPVLAALAQHQGYTLTHLLATHKHWDHSGGNEELKQQFPSLSIVGGAGDGVPCATREVASGDQVDMAPGFSAQVLQVPCHTKGHVVYQVGEALFTGDTLFVGGCGRFFEGNAKQMYDNLCKTLAALPDDTKVFCGHEYTVSNLEFGAWIEPDNAALASKLSWARERRQQRLPTIPSSIGEEKQINPFMRVREPEVVKRVSRVLNLSGPSAASDEELAVQTMDALRTLKNENAHKK